VDPPESPSKIPLKNVKKLTCDFLPIFFLKFCHCSSWVIYHSIELDLLYKTVYMTFLLNLNWESKNSKYSIFSAHKISFFFSILSKCMGQKSITNINFISFCSPFNAASNHILNIVLKCATSEIVRLEYRLLTPYFTYFVSNLAQHHIDICEFFL